MPVIYPKILGRPDYRLVSISTRLTQLCDGNIKENTVAGEWEKLIRRYCMILWARIAWLK
jgi:hypothetical protein